MVTETERDNWLKEAHTERIRRQALPSPPPDAMGISTKNSDDAKNQQEKATNAVSVDVLSGPPRPSFWDQYRSQAADLVRAQRPAAPDNDGEEEEVTGSAATGPSVVNDPGTGVANRNRMILRSGKEYRSG